MRTLASVLPRRPRAAVVLLTTSSPTPKLPSPGSTLLPRLTGLATTDPSSSRHFRCSTTLSRFSIAAVSPECRLKSVSSFLIIAPSFCMEERANIEAILG